MDIIVQSIGILLVVFGIFGLGVWFTRMYDTYDENKQKERIRKWKFDNT